MQHRLTDSRLANIGARTIYQAFVTYHEQFNTVTQRARSRFAAQDWAGMQSDAQERLAIYRRIIRLAEAAVRDLLEDRLENKLIWASMKAVYSGLISDHDNWELAETFFNSVTRRIFTTVGVDPQIEFVASDFETPPTPSKTPCYRTYTRQPTTAVLLHLILQDVAIEASFADPEQEIALASQAIDTHLANIGGLPVVERAEIVRHPFLRGMGAYLVGRLFSGPNLVPFVLAFIHTPDGLTIDSVLLEEDAVSILFSFARSYFHVEAQRAYDLVQFLRSIMPRKRTAELYISLGYTKHGKTELYRDMLAHLAYSDDRFEIAPGQRGMVMTVFTMPNYDMVFKLIKDQFSYPKESTRKEVLGKYDLVYRHDRAGRLVDAQAFEYLQFERRRFDPALLDELLSVAAQTVEVQGDHVIIKHAYVERRVMPLDLFIKDATPEASRTAVLDYGNAIKDLAISNIFPGDMLLKNFGVTRHGRVVFYDYDELCLLVDCNFRRVPPALSYEDELASEPWFHVAENDIFPEEFHHFIGLPDALLTDLQQEHGDLFSCDFWRSTQEQIRAGQLVHIFPYPRECRLHAPRP